MTKGYFSQFVSKEGKSTFKIQFAVKWKLNQKSPKIKYTFHKSYVTKIKNNK